jgi:hypothetical protein
MVVVRVIGCVVLVLASVACSSDPPAAEPPPTAAATVASTLPASSASPTTTLVGLNPAGCPVRDEQFCATAVAVADALGTGNAQRLLELSREDQLDCGDVSVEYFPDCTTADAVVEGHGLSGPDLLVNLIDRGEYEEWLRAITTGIDPSYTDELGDGSVRLIGIGTCGPDEPGRRTYHVAWTAALSADDSGVERVLGSFELLSSDGEWRIVLAYVGSLADWESAQNDAARTAFCEAGRSPWET